MIVCIYQKMISLTTLRIFQDKYCSKFLFVKLKSWSICSLHDCTNEPTKDVVMNCKVQRIYNSFVINNYLISLSLNYFNVDSPLLNSFEQSFEGDYAYLLFACETRKRNMYTMLMIVTPEATPIIQDCNTSPIVIPINRET